MHVRTTEDRRMANLREVSPRTRGVQERRSPAEAPSTKAAAPVHTAARAAHGAVRTVRWPTHSPTRPAGSGIPKARRLLLCSWLLLGASFFTFAGPVRPRKGQPRRAQERRSRPRQAFNTVRRAALARTQAKEDSQEPDGSVQQRKQSRALACSGRSLAEWRPLEAFYEPTQDTIFYSFLSVAAATVLAGGGLLIAQGLNAEYFILVFVLVVIAFGFLVALLGLKAVSPQESAPDGS
ncbi:unnamed protein product [Effrenium voratum]|nr:unnamed protein product [Effrenium voratum]